MAESKYSRHDRIEIDEFAEKYTWLRNEVTPQFTEDQIVDAFYHKVEVDGLMAKEAFANALYGPHDIYYESSMVSRLRKIYKERTGEVIESTDMLEVSTALTATYDTDNDGVVTGDEFWAGWQDSGYAVDHYAQDKLIGRMPLNE